MKPEKAADFFIQRAKRSQPNALCVKKSWLRFPEKVAVGSERQSGSFLEQDSTEVPKFTFCSFLPLRESCWGVTSPNPAMRLVLLKIPQNIFLDFSKIVPLHTLFFCYYPNTLPLSKSRYRGRKLQNHPSSQHLAAHG